MPFISLLKQRLTNEPAEVVFQRELLFNEIETVKCTKDILQKAAQGIQVTELVAIAFPYGAKVGTDIFTGEEVEIPNQAKIVENSVPGNPGVVLTNI